jgi:hypothetical protein
MSEIIVSESDRGRRRRTRGHGSRRAGFARAPAVQASRRDQNGRVPSSNRWREINLTGREHSGRSFPAPSWRSDDRACPADREQMFSFFALKSVGSLLARRARWAGILAGAALAACASGARGRPVAREGSRPWVVGQLCLNSVDDKWRQRTLPHRLARPARRLARERNPQANARRKRGEDAPLRNRSKCQGRHTRLASE